MKQPVAFLLGSFLLILILFPTKILSQTIYCPGITPTSTTICQGGSASLTASVVPVTSTTGYSVSSISYNPFPYSGGTSVLVNQDDIWSPAFSLPFNFCFYGNSYNQVILGANGVLSFDISKAGMYESYILSGGLPINPASSSIVTNYCVCISLRDINPNNGGSVAYYTTGTAPCRAFVAYYKNVPLFGSACTSASASTFQVVLYENTNIIDVYIENSTSCSGWNGGRGIIGLQKYPAPITTVCPAGRNGTTYTAINEAWRFTPTGAQTYTVSWAGPGGNIGTGLGPITVTPSTTTTYTTTMAVANCVGTITNYTNTATVTVVPNPTVTATSATLCSGQSASLTANGATSYTWSPATGLNTITGATVNANPSSTTVYTVTGTGNNGCAGNPSTCTVTVNAMPTVSVAATSHTLCAGTSTTLTATGAGSFTWSTSANGSSISVTPTVTTTYTVIGSNGNCLDSTSITITVNTVPTLTASPTTNPSACGSNTGSITGLGINGNAPISYTWTNSYGQTVGNTANISNDSAGTYHVHVQDANGCAANFGPYSITNPGAPAAPAITTNTNTACAGSTITFSASTAATNPSFNWSGPNGFSSSSASFTLSAAQVNQSGVYAVTVSSAGCTGAAATTTLTIHGSPLVSASCQNNPNCAGATVQLSGSSATSYTWSGPNSFSSNQQDPSISNSTTASTGVYTLSVTDANGCTSADTAFVQVNQASVIVGVSASSATLCAGQTINLFANANPSTSVYTWSGPNGFTSSLQNPVLTNASTLQSGTYTVTANTNGCGSTSVDTVSVLVYPTPVAVASANWSSSNCSAGTNTLSGSGGVSYTWSGPGGFSSNAQNPVVTSSGIYSLVATNSYGCSNNDTTSLTIVPTPTISGVTSVNGNNACVGDLIQLNANATPASSVFTWNGPGGFTSNSQNPFIPSNSTLYSGTFTVTATFGGCTSTSLDTITITIHPTPVAVASANWSSSNCSAGTNTLSGNGGVSYNWSGPGGFSSNAQNPVVTSSGIYTLVATNSYGCSNSDTTSITIIPTPTVSGVTSVNGSNACVGDVIQLNANATPASSVFTWNGPGGFTSNSQNPFVPSNSTLYSGTFTVTATFGGCTSTSLDTITITIHANPVAVASANWASVNCSTTTNTLSGSGGVSYSWNGPGGFGSVQQNPIVTLSGMYTLTVTDQNGCKSTDTTQITITQTPAPALVANAQTCKGSPLVLTATGSAGVITWYTDAGLTTQVATGTTYAPTLASGTSAIYYVTVNNNGCVSATQTVSAANYNVQVTASADPTSGQAPLVVNFSAAVTGSVNPLFSWNFASGNSNSSLQNPAFTYAAAGEYASVVTVTDAASGCVASDTLIIYVEDDVVLVIPNIFTPNGDGINDNFFITSTGVQRVEGSILDRWGETMFAWTGINSFWDGKAQTGMPVPDGTYFFVFKATLLNNETRTYKGTVTLLR